MKRYCVEVSCHYYCENGRVDVGLSLQEKDAHSGVGELHSDVGPVRGEMAVGCS